ncbi:MAG: SCO family protein, partial [Methylotenera sp.]|nr:SCO family protein [Methylotenera sp.]
IDHSAGVYVFDKTGKIRLYVDYGTKPADIAADIKKLL